MKMSKLDLQQFGNTYYPLFLGLEVGMRFKGVHKESHIICCDVEKHL